MSRIDTLQIHNFKFFNEQEPIKLDGKHLLLYGENGSGKKRLKISNKVIRYNTYNK